VSRGGFTLIEIVAAVAILGGGLLILFDCHYGALRLFNDTREEVMMQNFLEQAIQWAEMEVVAGELEGGGDFGARYPDYSYTFTGQRVGEEEASPLIGLQVSVAGPEEIRTMELMVFSLGY